MKPDIQSDARKDPDRLEREIDQQRLEISETLRALEEKFSSRELASHFMHYFGGHGREWADSLGSSLKANPIPALLTAVGVTWLMMGERNGSARPYYSYDYPYPEDDYTGRDSERFDGIRDAAQAAREKAGELGDRAAQAGEALHDKAAHTGEALHEKARHAREAWRARAAHARDGFGHSREHMRDGFGHLAREQPLALGALGLALGALLGAVLPRTEYEHRMLGRASERVREKGREMAKEGYEKAATRAAEVAEVADELLHRKAQEQQAAGSNPQGSSAAPLP